MFFSRGHSANYLFVYIKTFLLTLFAIVIFMDYCCIIGECWNMLLRLLRLFHYFFYCSIVLLWFTGRWYSTREVPHHLYRDNKRYNYILGGTKVWEKDLGVLVHEALKPSVHCTEAAKKETLCWVNFPEALGTWPKRFLLTSTKLENC